MAKSAWDTVKVGQLVCADIRVRRTWMFGADFQIQGVVVKIFDTREGAVVVDGVRNEHDPFGVKMSTTGYFVVSPRNYRLSIIDVGGALGRLEGWEE